MTIDDDADDPSINTMNYLSLLRLWDEAVQDRDWGTCDMISEEIERRYNEKEIE